MDKVVNSLREAIRLCGLEDGMTISFHHCLRGGDAVSVQIAEAIRSLGIRDLTVAPSSLTSGNDGLEDYIRDGTFTRFQTSGFSPALGRLLRGQNAPDSRENWLLAFLLWLYPWWYLSTAGWVVTR